MGYQAAVVARKDTSPLPAKAIRIPDRQLPQSSSPSNPTIITRLLAVMRNVGKPFLGMGRSYAVSAAIGIATYVVYGSLNDAWVNPALFGIAIYMFLSIPLYSKISNGIDAHATKVTGLHTVGRVSRYLLQLLVNLLLLWAFLAGEVLDPAGLTGIGGVLGAAAWITALSQGGQYLAGWLARRGLGQADHNVVLAIAVSVTVNALAVSGVIWVQPAYVALSLALGVTVFSSEMIRDLKRVFRGSGAEAR